MRKSETWSGSDKYFVSGELKVYSVDLLSEPLKMVPAGEDIKYDGPTSGKFKKFLIENDFRVNIQGQAIVRVPKLNTEDEFNFFLLEKLVPLGDYDFTDAHSPPPTQEVKVLRRLLDETRADLAKKNAEVDELHRKIMEWPNSEQLRLTMNSIRESMKKVFVDIDDLKSPAIGDPISVVGFLEKLRSVLREQEFGVTFSGAANETMDSIVSIFEERNGKIGFGLVKSIPSRTPSDVLQNLTLLREFVKNHFFIDRSVIAKIYGMSENDISSVISSNSESCESVVAKSIDDIQGESVLNGYFNIPNVGKFKGVLTRVNSRLLHEISVKLKLLRNHRSNRLDDNKFWFVKTNGEAIFQKSLVPKLKRDDWKGFFRRMNRTFVNKAGNYYIKFDFRCVRGPDSRCTGIRFYGNKWYGSDPIETVQFDENESAPEIPPGKVSFQTAGITYQSQKVISYPGARLVQEFLNVDCVFMKDELYCFGRMTKVEDATFRSNDLVTNFFRQSLPFADRCFVDAKATTFFVFSEENLWYECDGSGLPTLHP